MLEVRRPMQFLCLAHRLAFDNLAARVERREISCFAISRTELKECSPIGDAI